MREIKFRAWDKENKKMVYYDADCSAPNITLNGVLEKCCFGRDVPGIAVHTNVSCQYILEQYTGLKDKNGVEIYEGDWVVVKVEGDDMEFKGYVDFNDGSFRVNAGYMMGYRWIDYEIEVIGNIHQNKELLDD